MTGRVVVTKAGDELVIACPFEALDLIRTIPGRRWDKTRKVWIAPAAALPAVRQAFRLWPGGVLFDLADWPSTDWAGALFAAVPPRLHKRVHRALAGALHPDADGDHRAMQALNDAYANRTKTNRRTAA